MPYTLREENGKWCVYNKDTGENKGCSDSKEMAIQHMRALYAHEPGAKSEPEAPIALSMYLSEVKHFGDGRIRWRARCNTGEIDKQKEQFALSFFSELQNNFFDAQEAIMRGQVEKGRAIVGNKSLPIPILDVAHYSLYVPDRMMARAGWPFKLWVDGQSLMAEGYFDNTPIGSAAAKKAMSDKRPAISICVFPDWGNVEVRDDVLIYKGGRGLAHLDHLAMTMYPVNVGTEIIAEVPMEAKSTIAQDAAEVLGDEELAKKLEEARAAAKSTAEVPEGAVIKADDTPAPETAVTPTDAPVVEGEPVDKAARQDVSEADKKRAEKEYGDVTYADEENKKYPIDTEEHIRAAWSYINMPKNQAMYADKGAAIKAKIIAAWKRVIDKEGPPKAEEKSEAEIPPTPEPVPQPEAKSDPLADKYEALAKLVVSLSESLPKALQDLSAKVEGLHADVESLKASDTAKVKSAIDNGGNWLAQFYNPRKAADNKVAPDEVQKAEPKPQPEEMDGIWGYIAQATQKPGG